MSIVEIDDQFSLIRYGDKKLVYIQNICKKCGWKGLQHYAYNTYQHFACREERDNHREKVCVRIEDFEYSLKIKITNNWLKPPEDLNEQIRRETIQTYIDSKVSKFLSNEYNQLKLIRDILSN